MYKARQNFGTAVMKRKRKPKDSQANSWVYIIGGYNTREGALDHVERFAVD